MAETIAGGVMMVMTVILTIVLWSLFHKFVTRIYFGGIGNMILVIIFEILGCAVVAGYISAFIIGLIIMALKGVGSILSFIFGLILGLLKIALIVAAIGGIIYLIIKIVRKGKNRINITNGKENIKSKEILVCPNCGRSYREGDIFCEGCGFKLNNLTGGNETETSRICPNCGHEISLEDAFCQFCGKKLIEEEKNSVDKTSEDKEISNI